MGLALRPPISLLPSKWPLRRSIRRHKRNPSRHARNHRDGVATFAAGVVKAAEIGDMFSEVGAHRNPGSFSGDKPNSGGLAAVPSPR